MKNNTWNELKQSAILLWNIYIHWYIDGDIYYNTSIKHTHIHTNMHGINILCNAKNTMIVPKKKTDFRMAFRNVCNLHCSHCLTKQQCQVNEESIEAEKTTSAKIQPTCFGRLNIWYECGWTNVCIDAMNILVDEKKNVFEFEWGQPYN